MDKKLYNVLTLEALHKLMEEATYEDMERRITIKKCIEYLELQKKVFDESISDPLFTELVRRLQYEENSKKIIDKYEPDKFIYEENRAVYELLSEIIPFADV